MATTIADLEARIDENKEEFQALWKIWELGLADFTCQLLDRYGLVQATAVNRSMGFDYIKFFRTLAQVSFMAGVGATKITKEELREASLLAEGE